MLEPKHHVRSVKQSFTVPREWHNFWIWTKFELVQLLKIYSCHFLRDMEHKGPPWRKLTFFHSSLGSFKWIKRCNWLIFIYGKADAKHCLVLGPNVFTLLWKMWYQRELGRFFLLKVLKCFKCTCTVSSIWCVTFASILLYKKKQTNKKNKQASTKTFSTTKVHCMSNRWNLFRLFLVILKIISSNLKFFFKSVQKKLLL